jgi:hypothetical protein
MLDNRGEFGAGTISIRARQDFHRNVARPMAGDNSMAEPKHSFSNRRPLDFSHLRRTQAAKRPADHWFSSRAVVEIRTIFKKAKRRFSSCSHDGFPA